MCDRKEASAKHAGSDVMTPQEKEGVSEDKVVEQKAEALKYHKQFSPSPSQGSMNMTKKGMEDE